MLTDGSGVICIAPTASLQTSPEAWQTRCPNPTPGCEKSRKEKIGDKMVVDVCLVRGILNPGLTRSLETTKGEKNMNLK